MYLIAFAAFWGLGYYRIQSKRLSLELKSFNDLCFYAGVGVIVGGRIGYVLFYGLEQLIDDPVWLFYIWEGGMSFHGGLLGVIVAIVLFCKLKQVAFWSTIDGIAPLVPIGLGVGRIGNFINSELPGRVTESVLGVHFPCIRILEHNYLCTGTFEEVQRHVSSLYQAVAEGVILFLIVWFYAQKSRDVGKVSGVFLISYGVLRVFTELFREPDANLGLFVFELLSMGQILSLLMVVAGAVLYFRLQSFQSTKP